MKTKLNSRVEFHNKYNIIIVPLILNPAIDNSSIIIK